ncbi:MAG: transcriptional regulator [Faecousia sp.]
MLDHKELQWLQKIAKAVAAQFGDGCEVVIHDLAQGSPEHSIVAIENGQVTGRKPGDGPSQVVLEQMRNADAVPEDHLGYLTRTPDGRVLRSSTVYIPDENGKISAIFSINYDISSMVVAEKALRELITSRDEVPREPEQIPQNVNDLLDELILRSVELVGKPVALMNKDDKVRALQFLNESGALLITKSSDKISKYFGISKYTLYSYLDLKTGGESTND